MGNVFLKGVETTNKLNVEPKVGFTSENTPVKHLTRWEYLMGTGSYQKHMNESGWEDKSLKIPCDPKNQIQITWVVEEDQRIPFSLGNFSTSKPYVKDGFSGCWLELCFSCQWPPVASRSSHQAVIGVGGD